MRFHDFLTQNQVIFIFIATIMAYALTKITGSIEKNIIRPYIKEMKLVSHTKNINVVSTFIEFGIILLIIYLFYRFLIKRGYIINNNSVNDSVNDKNAKGDTNANGNGNGNKNKDKVNKIVKAISPAIATTIATAIGTAIAL